MSRVIPGIYLIMRERTYLYKALSELYKGNPHEQLIKAILAERFRGLGETVGDEFELVKGGHKLICDFIEENNNPKEIEIVLHREYEKILRGTSYALQRNYETMEKDVLKSLAEFYKEEAWVPPEGYPRELDHVSVQSEFMFFLCAKNRKAIIDRKADTVNQNMKVQRDFLYKHVYDWFPKFADELYKRAESNFYRGLAQLTKGFIAVDKDIIAIVMERISQTDFTLNWERSIG